jgi:hypothetical protein
MLMAPRPPLFAGVEFDHLNVRREQCQRTLSPKGITDLFGASGSAGGMGLTSMDV